MILNRGFMYAANRFMVTCALLALASTICYGQEESFSRAEVLEDFEYFKMRLLENHPGIGLYKSIDEFEGFFENIEVADSVSKFELCGLFSQVHQVILDGHTQLYQEHLFEWEDLFVPFQPYWDGQKLYVLNGYSRESKEQIGQEIVSLNGVESRELIERMLSGMARDGYQSGYPIWELNTYFFVHYGIFFGSSDNYSMVLRDDNIVDTLTMKGLPYERLLVETEATEKLKKSLDIQFDKENNTALLTIKRWTNYYLNENHRQRLTRELREATKEIERNDISHLIIDIRDNPGGNLKFSKYLLSYLLDEPFLMNEGYKEKEDGVLVDAKGAKMGLQKPKRRTFEGDVYVLINGGCFSNSCIFSAALKRYNRAVFIGEETGGSRYSMCSQSRVYMLPNTTINVIIPTLQMILKPVGENGPHGILPDYEVRPTLENLLNDEDVVMQKALELISGSEP